jgi:uncharacterized membrane protein YdjX (TVP38/TMEM64 family)
MTRRRLLVATALIALIALFFAFDLGQYFRLDFFKSKQAVIDDYRRVHPLVAGGVFFVAYIAITSVSVPGAAVMNLVGGAVFGVFWGTLLASFAASLGATAAFLSSRFLFREALRRRFGERLRAIDAGLEREGAFYLFGLRLLPVFPYVLVNLLMGLTPIRTRVFYAVSQLGMLPATLVYANAGTQIATIGSLAEVLSPGLIGSLVLLGIFPLIARYAVGVARARSARADRGG